jgi:hypothetical protein
MRFAGASMIWCLSLAGGCLLGACGGKEGASVFGSNTTTGGAKGPGGGASSPSGTGSGASSTTGGTGAPIITTHPPDDGSSGGSLLGDAACVNTAIRGEQRPITLYFMMDNSGSMNTIDPGQTLSRWDIVRDAIPGFAHDPANAGLMAGLDFFPEPGMGGGRGGGGMGGANASCLVTDYQMANVPIDVLPGAGNVQADAFTTAINGRMLGNGTPTLPALQGALAAAATWQTAHPERTVYVVFVTDGLPNGCNSSVMNAADAAAAGLAGMPSIKTYVLGVGPEVVANLDPIALAGGTNTAYVVTMGGAAALSAALAAIKGSIITCDYSLPAIDGGQLDFRAVNVQTRIGPTGTPTLINQVPSTSACGTGDGWYYDNPVPPGNPAPTKITLCPTSCDALQATPGGQLDVLLGCKTEPRVN